MIKNDANKVVKPVEAATTATAAATKAAHQRPQATEVDNHNASGHGHAKPNHSAERPATGSRPPSKLDLIKKFDGGPAKAAADQMDNEPTVRRSKPGARYTDDDALDECENNENIQFARDHTDKPTESDPIANNNNEYNNGNADAAVPPKPLPRTSRNNSASSLSSEYGFGAAAANEEIGRPVAKPRTTATNYKVHLQSSIHPLTVRRTRTHPANTAKTLCAGLDTHLLFGIPRVSRARVHTFQLSCIWRSPPLSL